MKHIKTLAITLCLLGTNTAFGADWTPYLQGVKNCGSQALFTNNDPFTIPTKLSADITQKSSRTDDIDEITDLHLKNATAFGYPISKVSIYQGVEGDGLGFTFATKDFSKVKSLFNIKVNGTNYGIGANKAWIIKGAKFNQYTSVPYRKNWDNFGYLKQYPSAKGVIIINNSGWSKYIMDREGISLKINAKDQSILCY